MSLKTDYLDGINGLTQKMIDVFTAGQSYITTNSATLTTSLQTAAAQGKTKFTVTLPVTFEPNNLKLKGQHFQAFRSGCLNQLGTENIFQYEVDVVLNESDSSNLQMNLNFNFNPFAS